MILFPSSNQRVYNIHALAKQTDAGDIFERFADSYKFSRREKDVMRLLISEKTNTEIAELLYISESTVKFHIHNLLKKTGSGNRTELLALYKSR